MKQLQTNNLVSFFTVIALSFTISAIGHANHYRPCTMKSTCQGFTDGFRNSAMQPPFDAPQEVACYQEEYQNGVNLRKNGQCAPGSFERGFAKGMVGAPPVADDNDECWGPGYDAGLCLSGTDQI